MTRGALILAMALVLAADGAQARTYHAPKAPRSPHAPRSAGEGSHRHRSGVGEVGTLGPSTFHPVKRYKGFSYLQHEKHPEKDD